MTTAWPPHISRRTEILLVLFIALLAFALRAAGHWYAPRGWREDELSNALVVSQHVLVGDLRIYYDDASGHEGLYHWLQAGTMALFGSGVWGVRGVSILLGTLAVLLTYLLARRLFDWPTAAIASLCLALSFWSLMYSRSGQRHISVTVTTLLSVYCLWRAWPKQDDEPGSAPQAKLPHFVLAGLWMGIGFYTYFASRGVPLIILAWGGYLLLWRRAWWQRVWPGLLITLLVAGVLAIPLIVTLQRQPEAEARVTELAKPINDARQGDFSTLQEYALTTLAMFTHNGDDEVLYNVPHRPVFGLLGGTLFWCGVALSLIRAFGSHRDPRHAFLLLWMGAGLAPGALSVPAASLGHTILAQPVAMLLPALTITSAGRWLAAQPAQGATGHIKKLGIPAATVLSAALLLLTWEGYRGIHDYWRVWPTDSFNRVLHHSDLHEAARWLGDNATSHNLAIGGFLNERWDQQVMALDLPGEGWQVRAFDPRSTYLLIPGGGLAILPEYLAEGWGTTHLGDPVPTAPDAPYTIHVIEPPQALSHTTELARFENGLSLILAHTENFDAALVVETGWQVVHPLDLPPFPLLSKPPAPGDDDTPRLAIFIQLLNGEGQRVAGADGLGVDPYTLKPGDVFVQRFVVPLGDVPPSKYRLAVGLYNPATGVRVLDTLSGMDSVFIQAEQVP